MHNEVAKRWLWLFALLCLPALATAVGKPNVLFIAVDDLNNALGCYGHPIVKTPNIDRLASLSVRFDRAYCQYPVCNPSRTSLLSGLRPNTTGVLDNKTIPREVLKDRVFLPQLFREHGYFTARVGKIFHDAAGFDDPQCWDVSEAGEGKPGSKVLQERNIRRDENTPNRYYIMGWKVLDAPDEHTGDGIVARRAAAFLDEASAAEKPFFVAAGFRKPHQDFIAPKKYFDLYDPAKVPLPKEPAEHVKNIPRQALNYTETEWPPFSERDTREAMAAYFACISFMDAQVGVLLDAMDRLKLWDSTVVVFFSDHGFHLGEHGGLWQKGTLFEEVARVPLLIHAPGKRTGEASSRVVELLDLYPTLAELCGLRAPDDLEGKSIVPLLANPEMPWTKPAITTIRRGATIRTERYRFTEWLGGAMELYDHDKDPREYVNIAGDPAAGKVVAEMKGLLRRQGQAPKEPAKPVKKIPADT